jgi:hypothetical protein
VSTQKPFGAALPVEGDGEPVGFVADALEEVERGRVFRQPNRLGF